MLKVLEYQMEKKSNEDNPETTGDLGKLDTNNEVVGNENFCPGKMLKEKILDQITQV